jgi:hypothetical protein
VVVSGTDAATTVLPILAGQPPALIRQRATVAAQVAALVEAHPLPEVLTSMPGVGVRTAEDPHLSRRQGLRRCPAPGFLRRDRPGHPSVRDLVPRRARPRGGNKRLKRALFLSAFASLHHASSRAYYDRKRAQSKRHNQAIITLARRRNDVLFATLRDGTLAQDATQPQALSPVTLAA